MIKKWFLNRLNTIMEHNDYPADYLTTDKCDTINKWTPADLIAREYLNNGGGSAEGFLGISRAECIKSYYYMCEIKEDLINAHMINEKAHNNFGFPLWNDYNFDK